MTPEDRAWADYGERFRRDVLPKLLDSACFLSIGTERGDFDVKQATEIGAALICDKPFMLVIPHGRHVSERLRRAADVIIDDWEPDNPDAQRRIADAIERIGL